ncbi:hypothetical protein [Dyadobacter sediminis]|uniref:Thioredoxin domain-containing protein n=1 Tax=Dyadobacter sediminis TaxID=1493691 RepID=A0A5R9KIC9_9BACT|nr:hypothetical protein [Dyadobacter sediminis]TLU95955.1 hypothetical protein FEM55_02045 [Dyadobacter sediminis]GGB78045.1 hypothetical protein GCM10011325_01910 [Dyadobacter sediminis]
MRLIVLTIIFTGFLSVSWAATDSLIIKGKILNLNGRLYRQAPSITFSRNNILQPQSELSKQAPLQADGSFRVSLPILFPKEEFYLDYGGKAFTTFLGSAGTVEIVFNGDSLRNAKKLFYFSGVNADANNQYAQFLTEETRLLNSSKQLGTDFFKSFWERSPEDAKRLAQSRAQLRLSAVRSATQNTVASPALYQWAKSISDEEQLQVLYEYALSNQVQVPKELLDSLQRLSSPPLTAQRVIWANRFGNYADLLVEEKKYTNPSRTNTLPVRLMSSLIRNNAANLTQEEKQRLDAITGSGLRDKGELDFMNKIFARNEMVLNLLFNYERENKLYSELFDSTATEFLRVRYLAKNLYKFSYKQQLVLSKYIQSNIGIPQFRQSLDEIVNLEVKDSANIRTAVEFKNVTADPVEVLPGYFFTASNDNGTSWLNRITERYKGKTIYITKWNLDDPRSREELDYIPALQANVPDDVVFVYLHLPGDESISQEARLRQYVVRHQLKGVHLFLDSNQMMDLLFRLNPLDAATFAVMRPNGKFAQKKAPAPSTLEKAAQAILEADKK